MRSFCLFLFFLFLHGCSEDDGNKYTPADLWNLAYAEDKKVEVVQALDESQRVLCSQGYGEGCLPTTGKRVKIKNITFIVIRFKDKEAARKEAIRIDQYYARDWVFDEVKGEPVLERFVKKVFKAVDP